MLVIGLTGGISCGKTTAAEMFADKGITVIDADRIAREVVFPDTEAYHKICEYFGDKILADDKTIDRKKLGKRIFQLEHERAWLERLLHPLIRKEMSRQVSDATSPYAILVIPLLLETEQNPLVSRVLVIDAPIELQQSRTQNRDNRLIDEINAIISTQLDRANRLGAADDVIQNDGSLENLNEQVDKLHSKYLKLSKQSAAAKS